MLKQHDKIHLEVANIKTPNLFNSKIYSLIENINQKFRKQLIGYITSSSSNEPKEMKRYLLSNKYVL